MLIALSLIAGGCATTTPSRGAANTWTCEHRLGLLTRDGCPSTATMRHNLQGALILLGSGIAYDLIDLDTLPPDDMRRGYPTPTLLYEDRDVFDLPRPAPPFPEPTWRLYSGGVPSVAVLEKRLGALLRRRN